MVNLSEDVRRRRWKFISNIMRKDLNNDCRTALTAKTGKTKDTMEKDGRERKGKNRMEELE